ncbi:MAG: isopeptide-forming domain-containing fimbrial protein [Planctomycetaceae bacterium]
MQTASSDPFQVMRDDVQLIPDTESTAETTQPAIVQTAGVARAPSSITPATFTPAQPRIAAAPAGYQLQANGWQAIYPSAIADYPDEYLFDGGDRQDPYHYEGELRAGLDSEDAVVEYADEFGKERVKPTNRVAVYAPRFGAVRIISSPEADTNISQLAGAKGTAPGATLLADVGTVQHASREYADGVRMRSRASEFGSDALAVDIAQRTALFSHTKLNNVFENLTFVKSGQLLQSEQARLAYGIQAAREWSQNRYPVMMAETEGSQTLEAWSRPLGMVGTEDNRTPGDLRIVKLADKKIVQPGDEITFTIRYDNIGDRELREIRIIDNLTPRLEYIVDSATSDRAGQLIVADNQEGSVILTFELTKPLLGKQGGVVTFKARVR